MRRSLAATERETTSLQGIAEPEVMGEVPPSRDSNRAAEPHVRRDWQHIGVETSD